MTSSKNGARFILFDTYEQYKAGTNKFIIWLASMAPELNESINFSSKATGNKSKGRRKNPGQKQKFTLTDIPQMAQSIASNAKTPNYYSNS